MIQPLTWRLWIKESSSRVQMPHIHFHLQFFLREHNPMKRFTSRARGKAPLKCQPEISSRHNHLLNNRRTSTNVTASKKGRTMAKNKDKSGNVKDLDDEFISACLRLFKPCKRNPNQQIALGNFVNLFDLVSLRLF